MDQTEWERIFLAEAKILKEEDSWSLTFDDNLVPNCPKPGWKQYIRNTSAWFQCSTCARRWPSNRVKVMFHMCLMNGMGRVKVRHLRHQCKKCPDPSMEKPSISAENIKILMERLVSKIRIKCYHENLAEPSLGFANQVVRSHHEPDHCEACWCGICDVDLSDWDILWQTGRSHLVARGYILPQRHFNVMRHHGGPYTGRSHPSQRTYRYR